MSANIEGKIYPSLMRGKAGTPEIISPGFRSVISPIEGHEVHSFISEDDTLTPLVLLHGALASRRYLMPTAVFLAKNFQVYVPEMPGHGASSKPAHALSVEQQADVLAAWLRAHKLESVFLFANSYGCQVSARMTAKYPELVNRFILTGPTSDRSAPTLSEQAFRLWLDGFGEPKGSQGQLFADLFDMSVSLAFETAHHMVNNDIRPNLEAIKCRTLVLRGGRDTVAPQRWTEEVAGKLAHSSLTVIEKAPHCVNYAVPEQLSKIVIDFLRAA